MSTAYVLPKSTHLPIKMESEIPHETAGTLAPLYSANGPSLLTVVLRQSQAPLNVPLGAHCTVCQSYNGRRLTSRFDSIEWMSHYQLYRQSHLPLHVLLSTSTSALSPYVLTQREFPLQIPRTACAPSPVRRRYSRLLDRGPLRA